MVTRGRGNVLFAVFVSMGLAFFVVFDLLPLQAKMKRLQGDCENLTAETGVKAALLDRYMELQRALAAPAAGGVAAVERRRLRVDEVEALHRGIRHDASQRGLTVIDVDPGLDTSRRDYSRLSVRITLSGPLSAFHGYLVEMLEHPALDRVESIRLMRTPDGARYELMLWLGVS